MCLALPNCTCSLCSADAFVPEPSRSRTMRLFLIFYRVSADRSPLSSSYSASFDRSSVSENSETISGMDYRTNFF